MKYPPRLHRIISPTDEDWIPTDGPDIMEQVPADPSVRAARDYDVVHFDLDPKNSRDAHFALAQTTWWMVCVEF